MSLERIWAPWRIEYLLGARQPCCPFCDAPGLGACEESLVLALRPLCLVILNRFPYTGCHLMVVPRRHVSRLSDLGDDEYREMMDLVRVSAERLQQAVRCHGMNLGMNLGKAAGAGIAEHIHLHIVPRWDGDTNFMAVIGDVRVVSQDVGHAWRLLRPRFEDLDSPGT